VLPVAEDFERLEGRRRPAADRHARSLFEILAAAADDGLAKRDEVIILIFHDTA